MSFSQYDLFKGYGDFVGFKNYVEVLTNDRFLYSLYITIMFTITATALQFLLGLFLAIVFTQDFHGKDIMKVALLYPMFIATVAVGTIWYLMFHNQLGPINHLQRVLGITNFSWFNSPLNAFFTIVIADLWQWTPFVFILLYSGLQNIDQELYQSAKIDGASSIQQFLYISLPLLSKTILLTVILRSMDSFREFGKVYVMTGGGPGRATDIITMFIYRVAFTWFRMDQASALVIFLLLFITSIYVLFFLKLKKD
jgi:multiple sugar transport system permease protein